MSIRSFLNASQKSRAGLTLLELLLFLAIFTIIAVIFVGILVSVTNVYVKESGASTVSREGDFLFRKIQGYIEESSALHDSMVNGAPTNILKLYTKTTPDLIEIYAENGVVKIKKTESDTLFDGDPEVTSSTEPLTNGDAVVVSSTDLVFTRYQNPDGKDFVAFKFTMSYKGTGPLRAFSQTLQGGVARVSAATFDSDLLPADNNKKIGSVGSNQIWKSINELIFFQGGNVGIGAAAASPDTRLEVDGPLQLLNSTAGCDANTRGAIRFVSGAPDKIEACLSLSPTSTPAWVEVAAGQ